MCCAARVHVVTLARVDLLTAIACFASSCAREARDIEAKYGKEKASELIARLRRSGHWYYDVNFPKDDDEVEYLVHLGLKHETSTAVKNTEKLSAKKAECFARARAC